jgi:hypothetical protein
MRFAVVLILMLLIPRLSLAGQTYHYEIYDEESGDLVAKLSRSVGEPQDGRIRVEVEYHSLADSLTAHQSYLVDSDYQVWDWEVQNPLQDSEYTGTKAGDRVRIQGTLEGEEIDIEHEVEDRPFFVNPSFSLQALARGEREEIDFWSLRPSDLSRHKMGASKKGIETIEVGGDEVDALKIQWGLTGFRSMFFQQELWFRPSDGVLLKSEPSRGRWTEFVREETTD